MPCSALAALTRELVLVDSWKVTFGIPQQVSRVHKTAVPQSCRRHSLIISVSNCLKKVARSDRHLVR